MKKFGFIMLLIVLGTGIAVAQTFKDGFYFAQTNFSGQIKTQAVLRVSGGRIGSANWNRITYALGVPDSKAFAASGRDASGWVDQAKKAEDYLVATQNTNAVSVEGVSIPVAPFFTLVKQALAAAPVPKGMYRNDGWFYAQAATTDEYNTYNTALITIVNGTMVDALWNGGLSYRQFQGQSKQNISRGKDGYPMEGSKSAWHIQADLFARGLLNAQDPGKIPVKANGTTDAVSGVTILVKEYLQVVDQALQKAR